MKKVIFGLVMLAMALTMGWSIELDEGAVYNNKKEVPYWEAVQAKHRRETPRTMLYSIEDDARERGVMITGYILCNVKLTPYTKKCAVSNERFDTIRLKDEFGSAIDEQWAILDSDIDPRWSNRWSGIVTTALVTKPGTSTGAYVIGSVVNKYNYKSAPGDWHRYYLNWYAFVSNIPTVQVKVTKETPFGLIDAVLYDEKKEEEYTTKTGKKYLRLLTNGKDVYYEDFISKHELNRELPGVEQ